MPTQVEETATRLGWRIGKGNVIVEGTSDVELITYASKLYMDTHGVDLLGAECSINAAGSGDDGGVEGVNRRLQLFRQLAQIDAGPDGKLKHRFIGLYDSDKAGVQATTGLTRTDSRIRLGSEIFLLRPIMPLKGGADATTVSSRFERDNSSYKNLPWELEDMISEELITAFLADFPESVTRRTPMEDRVHRDFTRDGKFRLVKFVKDYAVLKDLIRVISLIRSLRDYLHLRSDHVICEV